jgi:hypothetical protein
MIDQDLEKFLRSLRNEEPSAKQINKWQAAVQSELQVHRQRPLPRRWLELTAALLISAILGAVFFHSQPKQEEMSADNATIEYIVTKSN